MLCCGCFNIILYYNCCNGPKWYKKSIIGHKRMWSMIFCDRVLEGLRLVELMS